MAGPVSRLARLMTCNCKLHLFHNFWTCRPWAALVAFLSQMLHHTIPVACCYRNNIIAHSFKPLPWLWAFLMASSVSTTFLMTLSDNHHSCTHCTVEAVAPSVHGVILVMKIPIAIVLLFIRFLFMIMLAMLIKKETSMIQCHFDQLEATRRSS